jgi:hypothetical protein
MPKVNGSIPEWMKKNGTKDVIFSPEMDGNYSKPAMDSDNAT